jgi:hypothetical protein
MPDSNTLKKVFISEARSSKHVARSAEQEERSTKIEDRSALALRPSAAAAIAPST